MYVHLSAFLPFCLSPPLFSRLQAHGEGHTLINEQKDCYYFDSFGNQILNISILHSLRKMGIVTYKYNTKEIQSISSSSCGYFCLAFILAWRLKIPYDAFIALFSEEKQENNEAVCYKFIKQTINS